MRALLDVNVIIALFDPGHVFHGRAHEWWEGQRVNGWASCPLTENGVVRVMTSVSYSKTRHLSPNEMIMRLSAFARDTDHEFWPDEISIRDDAVFSAERIHGSRQITDLYLLALAVRREGRLATFDKAVASNAITGARPENLIVI